MFAADVKGDLSGMAVPGSTTAPRRSARTSSGSTSRRPGFPVEYLSLGGIGPGVPMRATVSDFGPLLLAKVLGANETQEQSLALVFHYADEKGLPLLDLSDLRALLTYLDSDAGRDELKGIGGLSPQTVGVLLRSLVGLETGGGTEFFGEPQLDVADLLRTAPDGRGIVSCLELPAVQDKPRLWSTVLMWLVAELFESFPRSAIATSRSSSSSSTRRISCSRARARRSSSRSMQTVRLIRSKGVGVFFVTQTPKDIPADVLGQLGNRVQHALRAFTPDDAKALRATVRTFPKSDVYDLEELLTQLGTGEAAVTILTESGVPTPVVHTRMRPPLSRMGPADDVDGTAREPALREVRHAARQTERARDARDAARPTGSRRAPDPQPTQRQKGAATATGSGADAIGDFLESSSGRALTREVVRGVFGMLKGASRVVLSAFLVGLALVARGIVVVGVRGSRCGARESGRVERSRRAGAVRGARGPDRAAARRGRARARSSRPRSSGFASRGLGSTCSWPRSKRPSAERVGCGCSCRCDDPRRSGRSRDELDPAARRRRRGGSSRRSRGGSRSRGSARESTSAGASFPFRSRACATAWRTTAGSSRPSA